MQVHIRQEKTVICHLSVKRVICDKMNNNNNERQCPCSSAYLLLFKAGMQSPSWLHSTQYDTPSWSLFLLSLIFMPAALCFVHNNNNNNNNNKLTFQKNAQLTKIVTQATVTTRKQPSLPTEQKSLLPDFYII